MSTTDADNLVLVCCCLVDGSRLLWVAKYRRGRINVFFQVLFYLSSNNYSDVADALCPSCSQHCDGVF